MEYPNIRSLREDHDFRQCDLASVLHVSQNTYSQYENGVIELTQKGWSSWPTSITSV